MSSGEVAAEVFGAGEFAALFVAFGFDDAEEEGFQFAQVAIADSQINAEAVPGLAWRSLRWWPRRVGRLEARPT